MILLVSGLSINLKMPSLKIQNSKFKINTVFRLFFWLYTLCMIATSLIPMDISKPNPSLWAQINPSLQNFLHVPMFMIFVYLFEKSFNSKTYIVIGTSIALGAFLEGIQFFVPGRFPGLGDMLLNITGAILGILFLKIFATDPNR